VSICGILRRREGETFPIEEALMAKYMMLLFIPQGRTREEAAAESPKWAAYTQELQDAGAFVSGEPLQGNETATQLRVRDGETQLTDGPFIEAKEYLAGYYCIEAPDLDAALAWAAKVPNAVYGTVEVRPVMEIPAATTA
jgi:hypothetical protein